MTLSLWRYTHLALALTASVFIFIASVTGIVLAIEPISNEIKPLKSFHFQEVTLGETLTTLRERYLEVMTVEIDDNHYVLADVVDNNGNAQSIYIDPKTGEKIGDTFKKATIYQFATTLHRSLFMGIFGRVLIAITAFLLMIIAVTGIVLVIKRQKSWKHFFHTIVKDKFYPYYHVIFGRWLLLPIFIITLTGIYLSAEKFGFLPKDKTIHNIDFEHLTNEPKTEWATFKVFQSPLSEVKKVEFPFSDDVEDYFTVQFIDKEVIVNQFTGEIVSEHHFPTTKIVLYYSLLLHTGRGMVWWAVILLLSCIGILFFMYSGFAITLSRRGGKIKNPFAKDICDYVILVGSETGTTIKFAQLLQKALLQADKKVFLAEMNAFSSYESIKHLVVMTSTYGQGDAPSNAQKFKQLLKNTQHKNTFDFSVVGFGSLAYPDFCKYAYEVDEMLENSSIVNRKQAVFTINNQSFEAFSDFVNQWAKSEEMTLILPKSDITSKPKKQMEFKVVQKDEICFNETFLIRLHSQKKTVFTSGDLLGITSDVDQRERLYSIGKLTDGSLQLSVKRHEKGVVSNYLNQLQKGKTLKGRIQKNPDFHFPKRVPQVVFIATGTGIAPFLGMIDENHKKTSIHLFFGCKTRESFSIYEGFLARQQKEGKLQSWQTAFSREKNKTYVQDLLTEQSTFIAETLQLGGVLMLCGSVAMQKGVTKVIDGICRQQLQQPLSHYQNKGQLKMDCY